MQARLLGLAEARGMIQWPYGGGWRLFPLAQAAVVQVKIPRVDRGR